MLTAFPGCLTCPRVLWAGGKLEGALGIQQPHSHLHSTGTSHTHTGCSCPKGSSILLLVRCPRPVTLGRQTPCPWLYSFISPSFHAFLPDIFVKQQEPKSFCCSYHHQVSLPISFMAVLVQLDLRDVGKRTDISREPGVRMDDLVVACLTAFSMTEYSVMWHRVWGELPPEVSQGVPVRQISCRQHHQLPHGRWQSSSWVSQGWERSWREKHNVFVGFCLIRHPWFHDSYWNQRTPGCFKSPISLCSFYQEAWGFLFMLYFKNASEQKVLIFLKLGIILYKLQMFNFFGLLGVFGKLPNS